MCPQHKEDVEVFAPKTMILEPMDVQIKTKNSGSDKCPMCLLAVKAAIDAIQSDKSKINIKNVLNGLCVHFPNKMQVECRDFVDTYTSELVDMLSNDFSAQDICSYLDLCKNNGTNEFKMIGHYNDGDGDICKYFLMRFFVFSSVYDNLIQS